MDDKEYHDFEMEDVIVCNMEDDDHYGLTNSSHPVYYYRDLDDKEYGEDIVVIGFECENRYEVYSIHFHKIAPEDLIRFIKNKRGVD